MDISERIEDYINGELNDQELIDFEIELANNKELNSRMKLHIEVDNAIREKEVVLLKKQLSTIHNSLYTRKLKNSKKGILRHINGWYLMAASIVLVALIGSIYIVLLKNTGYTNTDLYNMYYEPYEVVINVRSGNTATNNLFIQALLRYQDQDYSGALLIFEKIIETDSTNAACNFYTGVSFMETSKYLKASKSFNSVIKQNDNLFIEQAEWYLGLCYLKTNKIALAESIFRKISSGNSFYKDKAGSLLQNLK